jgi:hypothetical protein
MEMDLNPGDQVLKPDSGTITVDETETTNFPNPPDYDISYEATLGRDCSSWCWMKQKALKALRRELQKYR